MRKCISTHSFSCRHMLLIKCLFFFHIKAPRSESEQKEGQAFVACHSWLVVGVGPLTAPGKCECGGRRVAAGGCCVQKCRCCRSLPLSLRAAWSRSQVKRVSVSSCLLNLRTVVTFKCLLTYKLDWHFESVRFVATPVFLAVFRSEYCTLWWSYWTLCIKKTFNIAECNEAQEVLVSLLLFLQRWNCYCCHSCMNVASWGMCLML